MQNHVKVTRYANVSRSCQHTMSISATATVYDALDLYKESTMYSALKISVIHEKKYLDIQRKS